MHQCGGACRACTESEADLVAHSKLRAQAPKVSRVAARITHDVNFARRPDPGTARAVQATAADMPGPPRGSVAEPPDRTRRRGVPEGRVAPRSRAPTRVRRGGSAPAGRRRFARIRSGQHLAPRARIATPPLGGCPARSTAQTRPAMARTAAGRVDRVVRAEGGTAHSPHKNRSRRRTAAQRGDSRSEYTPGRALRFPATPPPSPALTLCRRGKLTSVVPPSRFHLNPSAARADGTPRSSRESA
jgi:hypothetical protein